MDRKPILAGGFRPGQSGEDRSEWIVRGARPDKVDPTKNFTESETDMDMNTGQKRSSPKEMVKEIWHPVVLDESPAEPSASPLGPLALADMKDAEEEWDVIVARVSLEQAAQLEADRAHHKDKMGDAAYGAAFAMLGTDTIEKIRTAVYNRVAASYMERLLQAELLERFGIPLKNFLADVWVAIDIESGCGAVCPECYQPFHEAAYEENLRTMDQDAATMAEHQAERQRQAAKPTD